MKERSIKRTCNHVSDPRQSAQSLQSCLTLSDPMDCSPPGSSVLRARIEEQVAMPSGKGSSDPGIEPLSPAAPVLASGFFTTGTN